MSGLYPTLLKVLRIRNGGGVKASSILDLPAFPVHTLASYSYHGPLLMKVNVPIKIINSSAFQLYAQIQLLEPETVLTQRKAQEFPLCVGNLCSSVSRLRLHGSSYSLINMREMYGGWDSESISSPNLGLFSDSHFTLPDYSELFWKHRYTGKALTNSTLFSKNPTPQPDGILLGNFQIHIKPGISHSTLFHQIENHHRTRETQFDHSSHPIYTL